MDALDRIHAFERATLRSLATTVESVMHGGRVVGEVFLTAPATTVRDHNAVWLDSTPHLDATAVEALLERELGGRGFAHRRLYCTSSDADRWASVLQDLGHERADTVVLQWPGGRLAATSPVAVVEADADLAEAAVRELRPSRADADEVAPYAWLVRAQLARGATVLVALDAGRPIGAVRVFRGEALAQVEELDVHPDARGRGVGRSLLADALARVAEVPTVVVTADPDDWPARWYRRLGFRRLGRSSGFVRAPGTGAA